MAEIKLTGDGWSRLSIRGIKGKLTPALRKNIRRAVRINSRMAQKAIRRQIRNNTPPPNASLTVAVKGSSKTLVDKGQLFKSVTTRAISEFVSEVGLVKGTDTANIAQALHDGVTIKVTPQMRALFKVLAGASQGRAVSLTGRAAQMFARYKNWKPLKASTTAIVIRGRPFIKLALDSKSLQNKAAKNYENAIRGAWTGNNPPTVGGSDG